MRPEDDKKTGSNTPVKPAEFFPIIKLLGKFTTLVCRNAGLQKTWQKI